MKYLKLQAELGSCPLQEEFELPSTEWPCELQPATMDKLMDWSDRYLKEWHRPRAPDPSERREVFDALDREGVELARLVVVELRGEAKMTYFGTFGWLPVEAKPWE